MAEFVWVDSPRRRNMFVVFRRSFHLDAAPERFPLALFADTRYRLLVNGRFVAAGPGRFFIPYPEFDEIDIAGKLQPGANEVTVEVNWFGASSFQTMPDSQPGLIAWGGAGGVDLSTPGDWSAEDSEQWASEAPAYSFAQGPAEIRDFRKPSHPVEVRVLQGPERPWGPLLPYSGTPLPFDRKGPDHKDAQGSIEPRRLWGFNVHNPGAALPEGQNRPLCGFSTRIWSPKAQTVEMDGFWSQCLLNGETVDFSYGTPWGNHASCSASLKEGWNHLFGSFEVLTEYWTWLTGFPLSSGVSLHADQDTEDVMAFRVSGLLTERPAPGDEAHWSKTPGDPSLCTPARVAAWDRFVPGGSPVQVHAFGFKGEFHGHLELDVEGPAGSIVDVTTDDWQNEDGTAALYRSNPFCDTTERFVLAGGRQVFTLFHPRGGKVVQVTLRGAGTEVPRLHDLAVYSRQIWSPDLPEFSCGHRELDWAWRPSFLTLSSSTDDAYSDCPWRERGSYIGDCLVNMHLTFLMTHDLRTARRTMLAFGRGQREDGQLPGVAPAWLRATHEDYTLLWIIAVRDYWLHTGDREFLEECRSAIERIWLCPSWKTHESGLWSLIGTRAFLDWGILSSEKEGEANACVNILRVAAARATGEILSALGHADPFSGQAESVERAIFDVLWNPKEGRLLPGLGQSTHGLHANTLALWSGLGTEDQRSQILAYLEPLVLQNLKRGLDEGPSKGHLELYFFYFLLPALAEAGRPDLAEQVVADHFGYLMTLGDDTLPECFSRAAGGVGSRCHSWSGAPALYAARYVLGLRQTGPREFLFRPMVHGIASAKGSIPCPGGIISVEWKREGGDFVAHISSPDGVLVRR